MKTELSMEKHDEQVRKITTETTLPDYFARCYPFPECPTSERCARFHHEAAMSAMNASPYRTEEGCGWFLPMVRDQA